MACGCEVRGEWGGGGEWTGACGCGCGCEVRGEWRRQGRVALGVDVK